jgi:tight adherence protein B
VGTGGETTANLYRGNQLWETGEETGPTSDSSQTTRPSTAINKWRQRIELALNEAGLPLSPRQFVFVVAGVVLIPTALGLWLGGWLVALVAGGLGAVAPFAVIVARRTARREKYLRQLAGAFELMARALRSGKGVNEAFRAVVEGFDDPLASEFAQCVHQIEHGLRPEEAYGELSQRGGILELRIFVVAMAIQRQNGGNLAEMLERLSGIVKARILIRKKLRALTAEGRMQSTALFVLPFLTFGVMYFLNRQYAEKLLENWKLLAATIGCMGLGMAWIRNIMKLDI